MKSLILKIINNESVKSIKIRNKECPKVIAYADYIAILTANRRSINEGLKTYEEFSLASGLYLNAEKTEILNMNRLIRNEYVRIQIYNQNNNINLVDNLTICGKNFSCNPEIERMNNCTNKIQKVERAIQQWKRRNLTPIGRTIIAKTFGTSQVIFMMQNSHWDKKDLKKLEQIIYKFIWNGPDKIKRETLAQTHENSGLKAPSINSINNTLKLKQLIRSSQTTHPISWIQNCKIKLDQPVTTPNNHHSKFIKLGVECYNKSGINIIEECLNCGFNEDNRPTGNVSRKHFIRIGNFNINTIAHITSLNPINRLTLTRCTNTLQINNLAQLLEAKNNEISHLYPIIRFTTNKLDTRINLLHEDNLLRMVTNKDESERLERMSKIPINVNI